MDDIPAAFYAKFPDASEADLGRAIKAGAAGARADAAALFAEADALQAEGKAQSITAAAFVERIKKAAEKLGEAPEDVSFSVLDAHDVILDVESGYIQPVEEDLDVLDRLLAVYVEREGTIDGTEWTLRGSLRRGLQARGFGGSNPFFIDLYALAVIDAFRDELDAASAKKADAPSNVLAFPSGTPGGRTAQVVYDEMCDLAAELQDLTGAPVGFTATPTAKGGFTQRKVQP